MNEVKEIPPSSYIPTYPHLKEMPSSPAQGLWIISMAIFPLVLWGLKSFVDAKIEYMREMNQAKLEEYKRELEQRDELVKHVQDQNAVLLNEIVIMRRTMDFSGELEVKPYVKK
ncbi:hypothetical protein [Floridanema evergladense]|uniref:Septum formation initiator n=1 Tax=Floridaenema evergladense BLCC-F167 TaxID=3153639 RepID=A0ABV4WEH3_9CYAN